jgi:hypothetical protein
MSQLNLQNVSFPITLSIPEAEVILAGLMKIPKEAADPVYAKIQQTALQTIQTLQNNPQDIPAVGTSSDIPAQIDEAQANSDSMANE